MKLTDSTYQKVFITGVTGFVGKVVLEELIRRKDELKLEKIFVLIRSGKNKRNPVERFENEVVPSPCFSHLPKDWCNIVHVISGELSEPGCDIKDNDRQIIFDEVTHIINCAASIEFDMPIAEAAAANITSSLNILEVARSCKNLVNMTHVSTAYVTPLKEEGQDITETLVNLPRPAISFYQDIIKNAVPEKQLLQETGHPNTYTFTKCIAEHLLTERKGDVPLTIVRPSIVSACWRHPFPGWIDSKAAFAAFVSLIGAGYFHVVAGQKNTLLDIIPCDEVAKRIIDNTFVSVQKNDVTPSIFYAVSGVHQGCNLSMCEEVVTTFFQRHPVYRRSFVRYIGSKNLEFLYREWRYHSLPLDIMNLKLKLTNQKKQQSRIKRLKSQLHYINRAFPYFTHNTFNFRASQPFHDKTFTAKKYVHTVCRGVYRYLMKKDETSMALAGKRHRDALSDFRWVRQQPYGNWAIRSLAYIVRKGLRKCVDLITFDKKAFETAREAINQDDLMVIVPNHRSYMDFVLCSYLFFAHPDLKIAIPHIAAAEEFSRIPILGWLFKQTHAFYVKRGLGRENVSLTKQVHHLADQKQTLEFFIEGTRSRSRKLLKPRRGMLKCLQSTKKTCRILPIAITYDRVPEEGAFIKELKGGSKPKMKLWHLSKWLIQMLRGKVHLGHIHITCGEPLTLKTDTDVSELGKSVISQLQAFTYTTTHHLCCFIDNNPQLELHLDWLQQAIEKRGGKVINSRLGHETKVNPTVELTMRYHWIHLFFDEAKTAFTENPAIMHFIKDNTFWQESGPANKIDRLDPRVQKILNTIFEPVCADYLRVIESLGTPNSNLKNANPKMIVRQHEEAHLPTIESAFEFLEEKNILTRVDKDADYQWGDNALALTALKTQCAWQHQTKHLAIAG